jgi:hypothetical protein
MLKSILMTSLCLIMILVSTDWIFFNLRELPLLAVTETMVLSDLESIVMIYKMSALWLWQTNIVFMR